MVDGAEDSACNRGSDEIALFGRWNPEVRRGELTGGDGGGWVTEWEGDVTHVSVTRKG